jgi:hypothetical protein
MFAAAVAVTACSGSDGASGPPVSSDSPVVLAIAPAANSTGVNPASPIVITFNHRMMTGMELLVMLHKGTVAGPQVAVAASWSPDRTILTVTPNAPLETNTVYELHLSPNLKDTAGNRIDFAGCARSVGGQPVSGGLFGWGGYCGNGPGWKAGSGPWGYGMTVTFTTT